MEWCSLIVKWLTRFTHAPLTCAEGSEVLSGIGHLVSEQLNDDSAGKLITDTDIEEDEWVCHIIKYV